MASVTQQSGAASSTPSAFKRWALSKLMTHMISDKRLQKKRRTLEKKRRAEGRAHVVEYFHQVDDGYSHLALQTLAKVKARYAIDLVVHLVPDTEDDNFPEPALLQEMSRRDAWSIAPYYGLEFPETKNLPDEGLIDLASRILCYLSADEFIAHGPAISDCLWRGDKAALDQFAATFGVASDQALNARLDQGAARRAQLKHYSGAMFYYEGEWYWGVDRLYHLEDRLVELGAAKDATLPEVAAAPTMENVFGPSARHMTLEYFPSLRSPYTAISWDPTMRLAAASGINLVIRPVLPMVMRGVPATFEKAFYVFKDAMREAVAQGSDFGNFYDPIGKPVMQGYSLYMWAESFGKGKDVLAAFLEAAFSDGVNTNSRAGMRRVAEQAGLNWADARHHLDDDTWQDVLEQNRLAMYDFGSWGVPSYRLSDEHGNKLLSVWGQDRLWLIAKRIHELSMDQRASARIMAKTERETIT